MPPNVLDAGSTYRFTPNDDGVFKDGAVWDLTGATVYLVLTNPAGVTTQYAATITGAAAGLAEYVCSTTLLTAGRWTRTWRFVQGSIDITYPAAPIPFTVQAAPF